MAHRFRPGAFAQSFAAYAVSEAAGKATRLLVVIAVARSLGPAEIGLAAAAMAAGDILKALTENGIGQRIVAAPEAALAGVCRTAHRIFWAWSLGLFALQCAIAAAIWGFGGSPFLAMLLVVLAGEYLFMPGGLVQAALAMRAGKLRQTAAISGAQVCGANLASALMVLVWPSAIALILPRLLSAPIWLIAMRRLHPWRVDRAVAAAPLQPFAKFGVAVLGVEIVKALRLHADKLTIGWILGSEALGIYFMAFNAGLGLANSFTQAFSVVLFPHLATATDRPGALRQALRVGLGLIAPAVVLKAALAPVYVPVLLGQDWADISPVVSVLCLAAIPGVFWSTAAGYLRAEGRPGTELVATAATAAALVLTTLAVAPHGLFALACSTLAVIALTQVGFALTVLHPLYSTALIQEA